ncbi:MAG: UDP-N-acetylmuramoyl-L-alanyl-D-glutamate--2,6-diaminopimelate ligase [Candidatus Nomurabacteria bacterium]|nr:UDP-N-acetylmuramoyl-L-alanyl-D-glutamate--2,6-diaminopimelate ligase [Candidatus Nomurabacteria bacterium]USN87302.1 MAG: UDP-N-acetylmuramoyl-L-alanyl-D-glutamate--2,6-diaminopimelate ligase [Candidatus Nomurabacteria bacterium]
MSRIILLLKKLIPKPLLDFILPYYHYSLAYLADRWYKHPSKEIFVIGVTGTKGKSSVTELMARILEANGHKVASLSTIQFKIGDDVERNLFKMTMPGRFFVQRFLRQAVEAGCSHAVIEITSEGARQFRHNFLELNALIFTNLSPEHIESHGSFEKYKQAKLSIAKRVEDSIKRPRYIVANIDDEHGQDFLNFDVEQKLPYSLGDLSLYSLHRDSVSLVFGDTTIRVPMIGLFNVYNILAAITLAKSFGISYMTIDKALRNIPKIAGRVEKFTSPKNATKNVTAIVDYAHTTDSLEKLYQAFPDTTRICVLGNTGGGRDTWKRPEMGAIADKYCDQIILTNEDPYDENPRSIVDQMAKGIENKDKLEIIMDRREAIRVAIDKTPSGGYVIVSGKGTDPYIMGPNGTKTVWSDAEVVQEELAELAIN